MLIDALFKRLIPFLEIGATRYAPHCLSVQVLPAARWAAMVSYVYSIYNTILGTAILPLSLSGIYIPTSSGDILQFHRF